LRLPFDLISARARESAFRRIKTRRPLQHVAKREALMSRSELFNEAIRSLSAIAPIVISCAALAISWFFSSTQKRMADAKLNFDVFGKRYEIYEATRSLIDRVKKQEHAGSHPTELRALGLKLDEGCFFFDRSTQLFLKEVWTVSDRILLTRDRRKHLNESSDEVQWRALGEELSADEARLSEMYSRLILIFERAMGLTELVKERGSMPRTGEK
jgi:hypothetical protein